MYYYLMANSSTLRFTVFSTYTMYKRVEMISKLSIENLDLGIVEITQYEFSLKSKDLSKIASYVVLQYK